MSVELYNLALASTCNGHSEISPFKILRKISRDDDHEYSRTERHQKYD